MQFNYYNTLRIICILLSCYAAYSIRTHALTTYGNVIHEFDPWFNYRATQYLQEHGTTKFFEWYDNKAWYPLGRPVGDTIYPGMQFAAVGLHSVLDMSLNDICCYIPVWFGVLASLFTGLLTYECTQDANAGTIATMIMAIIPAHLMRSVGGGYDNESVAMTTMCATFYFWCRSLRNKHSYWFGVATAVAYFCMVATWGGYIFVLNLIAVHTLVLMLLGRCSLKLHRAYSLFYVLGTVAATRVPIVGMAPFKSLEQIGALGVFGLLQLWWLSKKIRAYKDPKELWSPKRLRQLHLNMLTSAVLVTSIISAILFKRGFFGPISSRVRGLFVKHTRTGNPLVDSVAEHQPATTDAYFRYLQNMFYWYPIGLILLCFKRTDSKLFPVVYGCVAYYFSSKMSRLVLLMGPVTSVLAGTSIATAGHWSYQQTKTKTRLKKAAVVLLLSTIIVSGFQFIRYSFEIAPRLSHPSIMFQSTLTNGQAVIIDDYREAYTWLRDKTPQDARVMAWWDYGYQINGIAERTTIADGNTWNHEHIATLGRCLVSPEQQAHAMVKHLADYVLIWSGSGGDLAKSPHMARIGNSVYKNICPDDITCAAFGFRNGKPTKMMEESLLYKLDKGLVNTTLFQHVYDSKYRLVRIYRVLNIDEKSKKWGETNNQYSPASLNIISGKQNFQQLEDFNQKSTSKVTTPL